MKVLFNIKGTKWVKDGRENYITNLDAWRMETVKLGQDMGGDNEYSFPADAPPPADMVDDLPF